MRVYTKDNTAIESSSIAIGMGQYGTQTNTLTGTDDHSLKHYLGAGSHDNADSTTQYRMQAIRMPQQQDGSFRILL
jgi:hypothetical protein